ncbi:hypothetical protein pipiens_018013 [Culex pipiens pipiens]|uniref:40S ribosomal protein S2 n=1 Tax=Culex pipiens pipiens TaxID=38569 RepID=A0ABD1CDW3_CULPP
MPVQKQTRAGQRTRFKAFVAIGDSNGLICLGVKCSKEVATAIRGAIILAKLSVMPVRRGYWGNKIGKPHTVLCKVFGKCGYRPGAPQSGSHCAGPGPEEAAADGRYRGLRRSRETRNPGHQLHQSLRRFFRHVTLTVIQKTGMPVPNFDLNSSVRMKLIRLSRRNMPPHLYISDND